MSVAANRLQQLFGAETVASWEPPTAALHGFLPAGTPVVSPARVEEVREVLRYAARERRRVLPAGSMEHLHLGAPPGAVDFVLSARRLNRVLEYEPADLTLVVEAGVTLNDIETQSREFGQHLGPDPWPGRAATIGGACAANRYGLTRLRSGTLRDSVLGARVVHADGTCTRTGGKVVKNVTGYDLAKLYVGSLGSLAFIAEINLRLVVRPTDVGYVAATLPVDRARQHLLELQRGWLRPTALLVLHGRAIGETGGDSADLLVLARFEGARVVVQEQVEECAQRLDGSEPTHDAAASIWEDTRRVAEPEPDTCVLRVASLPVAVVEVVAAAREIFGAAAVAVGLFGVGASIVRVAGAEPEAIAAFCARMHADGGVVTVDFAPAALGLRIQPPTPPAVRMQAAIKSVYDPDALLRSPTATEVAGGARGRRGFQG